MDSRVVIVKELHTVRDFVRWAVSRFTQNKLCFGHGTDNAWDEALQLVLHSLHIPLECTQDILDARLTSVEKNLVQVVVNTRVQDRIPVPYLTGVAWFAGLPFKVDERVLIPRSPIAELLEQGFEPWIDSVRVERILDLCTGCGCIGIAAAHYFPAAEVDLLDVSAEALEVAEQNIAKHDMADSVRAIQSDLFAECDEQGAYDVIVSNPPYVDQGDLDSMPAEYHHEPRLALAAGDDGLNLVKRILVEAAYYLKPEGVLIVEVGNSERALCEVFPEVAFTWLEFQRGGQGVFVLTAEQLRHYFK